MVDVNAYRMIHLKDKAADYLKDDSKPISEEHIGANEALLLQLPRRIEGFHMHEKRWSKCAMFQRGSHP